MHPGILAAQEQQTSERLADAVARLSEKFGLAGDPLDIRRIRKREARLQNLRRNQAIADFLENLEGRITAEGETTAEQAVLERVLALELTKTSRELIEREFAKDEEEDDADSDDV